MSEVTKMSFKLDKKIIKVAKDAEEGKVPETDGKKSENSFKVVNFKLQRLEIIRKIEGLNSVCKIPVRVFKS